MKFKSSGLYLGLIILILALVLWKLNDYYKSEKANLALNQIHQQNLNLKTNITTQLSQLKNIISGYQGQINESTLNWVQLNPFFVLAQVDIKQDKSYKINSLFVKSGTVAENWSTEYLQKALSYNRHSGQPFHLQLFQNHNSEKFITFVFKDIKNPSLQQAVLLVGEANYFQKFFDIQRSAQATNVLMTKDKIVAGHSQVDYIATKTKEFDINKKQFYLDKEDLRSTNLILLSYSPMQTNNKILAIPPFITLFIFGLAFLLMGLVLYYLKPQAQAEKKAEIFKKVFNEVRSDVKQVSLEKQNTNPIPTTSVEAQAVLPSYLDDDKNLMDFDLMSVKSIEKEIEPVDLQKEIELSLTAPVLPESKPIEIQRIVLEVMNEFNGKIKFNFENLSLKKYELDINRYKKAFVNLFNNSVEANATEIDIKIFDIEQDVCIEIKDNGMGLSESIIEKVWQPYFGTKDKLMHKGLGLPEALSIVRRYGGDIIIKNKSLDESTGIHIKIFMNGSQANLNQDDLKLNLNTQTAISNESGIKSEDLDLDQILKLDDILEDSDVVRAELTTQAFHIEKKNSEVKNQLQTEVKQPVQPQIKITKSENAFDQLDFKIRRPGKS